MSRPSRSRRAFRPLVFAVACALTLAAAPAALAVPDLDDVKDKAEEAEEEARDKAEEAEEEVEDRVEENVPEAPAPPVTPPAQPPSTETPDTPSVGGGNREPRGGGTGGGRPSGGGRGGGSSRSGGSGDGGSGSSGGDTSSGAGFAEEPATAPVIDPYARRETAALLGPATIAAVARVPRAALAERPSRRQTALLRRRLAQAGGCLGDGLQAQALRLRAGGRSWVGVGRALNIPASRALGLGRLGLRRLGVASAGCGGAAGGIGVTSPRLVFAERFGAVGVATGSAVLAVTPDSSAAPGGSAPASVAERTPSGRGEVLGDSARGSSAGGADAQSSYVGPAGASIPLAPGSEPAGNGQTVEVLQAFGLLGLALLLALIIKYRLRDPEPVGAGADALPGPAAVPARAPRGETIEPGRESGAGAQAPVFDSGEPAPTHANEPPANGAGHAATGIGADVNGAAPNGTWDRATANGAGSHEHEGVDNGAPANGGDRSLAAARSAPAVAPTSTGERSAEGRRADGGEPASEGKGASAPANDAPARRSTNGVSRPAAAAPDREPAASDLTVTPDAAGPAAGASSPPPGARPWHERPRARKLKRFLYRP